MAEQNPTPIISPVTLTVAGLARAVDFYRTTIGFNIHHATEARAALGAGGEDLLILEQHPGAARSHGTTGLYHFAILVPTRLALAQYLRHVIESRVVLQGMSDHAVSEAIYLADPEGNGIEVYRDRRREQWPFVHGQLRMTTDPLEVEDLLAEIDRAAATQRPPWQGMPEGTVIGHVHLRVADVAAAESFYRDVLGLDVTTRFGDSASFLSRAGYHHHIGVNTWGSRGAPPAPPGALGLKHFTIRAASMEDLSRIEAAATRANLPVKRGESGLFLRDPAGNGVIVSPP